MFAKSSEKYLLIASVLAIVLIDQCYSSTFITPPIVHPGRFFSSPIGSRLYMTYIEQSIFCRSFNRIYTHSAIQKQVTHF